MPYLRTEWGNRRAERRSAWASAAGPYRTDPSCAAKSNNTASAAALRANPAKRHIVTSQVEHSSVLNYCMALSSGGFTPPPGAGGDEFTSPDGSRSGEFTSPDGGMKPPLRETTGAHRVTCLPVDRDGLLKLAGLTGGRMILLGAPGRAEKTRGPQTRYGGSSAAQTLFRTRGDTDGLPEKFALGGHRGARTLHTHLRSTRFISSGPQAHRPACPASRKSESRLDPTYVRQRRPLRKYRSQRRRSHPPQRPE